MQFKEAKNFISFTILAFLSVFSCIYACTRERSGGAVSVTIVSKKSNHKNFKSATANIIYFRAHSRHAIRVIFFLNELNEFLKRDRIVN